MIGRRRYGPPYLLAGLGADGYSYFCEDSTRGWRYLPDGRIEIEGKQGTEPYTWPKRVNDWAPLIAEKAHKHGVPAIWVAAIMAVESGGKPDVCYRPAGAGSPCDSADGAGLMAMLDFVASNLAGRTVTLEELMADPDLAVDLGAQLIRLHADKYGFDFMKVALAYNAGSVRCSRSGSSGRTVQHPKESCPPTPWGVIMGCVRTKYAGDLCAPSQLIEGMNVCPNDYPGKVAGVYNAAVAEGWRPEGKLGVPPGPGPITPPAGVPRVAAASLAALGLGALAGFVALRYGASRLR